MLAGMCLIALMWAGCTEGAPPDRKADTREAVPPEADGNAPPLDEDRQCSGEIYPEGPPDAEVLLSPTPGPTPDLRGDCPVREEDETATRSDLSSPGRP